MGKFNIPLLNFCSDTDDFLFGRSTDRHKRCMVKILIDALNT